MSNVTRSIIIPFYNEEKRFDVEKFKNFSESHYSVFFCLVNDGSIDGTFALLKELQSQNERINVLDLHPNRGKAEAIRQGMIHVLGWMDFKYIAFLDADFSAPAEVIPTGALVDGQHREPGRHQSWGDGRVF